MSEKRTHFLLLIGGASRGAALSGEVVKQAMKQALAANPERIDDLLRLVTPWFPKAS
jgi:hypothetical protein